MPKEIERKFLVDPAVWAEYGPYQMKWVIRQGYLNPDKNRVVRVRSSNDKGYLTIKGPNEGISRDEFEYEIPIDDATYMLDNLCAGPLIEKTRYKKFQHTHMWDIDIFHGENDGLILAEVELKTTDEKVFLPEFLGTEVSSDPRYFNSNLIANPYKNWRFN